MNSSVRDFLFRGLMFEAEAESFRRAGLNVGSAENATEIELLHEGLAPFGIVRRDQALEMSRLYAILYCFENSVRDFIRDALEDSDGSSWVEKLPAKVKGFIDKRMADAVEHSWLEGQDAGPLSFAEFGHLASLVVSRWELFSDFFPSQAWVTQRLEELEKARNFIAHNRMLQPSEFSRIYMYIRDWNRQVGL